MPQAPHTFRSRLLGLFTVALTIAAGLLWRSSRWPLPPVLKKYGGDALWALMIFFLIQVAAPRWPLARRAAVALFICCAVEFGQLYQAPWIESIRRTRLGHLVLGSTFNAPDLFAYAVGVALGLILTWCADRSGVWCRTSPTPSQP